MHVISSYLKVSHGPGMSQVVVYFKPSFSYFHTVNSQKRNFAKVEGL